ncbi:chemotaxis protein CheB [Sphingomonas gellani]|nr:chemotaxis protein CheB [Sphingomonas gellani]
MAEPAGDRSRVLIVDDSAVARAVIARCLEPTERFVVAGSVAHAAAALRFLQTQRVDFILLDVQMPGVDGITALPDLLVAGRGAKVIVVSTTANVGAAVTVQALAQGAADTLAKPASGESQSRFRRDLIDKLDRLDGAVPPSLLICPLPDNRKPVRPLGKSGGVGDAFDLVAIGASTGGIHALSSVLRMLPVSFTLPVLVTQHLPASFMPYFAAQLALVAGRPCDVATDHLRLRPGRIVIAPGDAHIRCIRLSDGSGAIRLSQDAVPSGCLPSVDPMLQSAAAAFGDRVMAIVLSGMGRDGADGARRVHEAGGCVVVQDRESSVVWGMPGTVAAMGIADAQLPPDRIGRLMIERRRP